MDNGNRENLGQGNKMVMGIDSGNSTKVQGIPVRTNPNQNDTIFYIYFI